ncbi:MAG: phosphoesterase, partial [Sphingomonadaceae bacterium]
MVPLSFAGHALVPLRSGALWWPAERLLVVADLHLEKASHFARQGWMLPPYDSLATLRALERDVSATGASAVAALGDSF